MLRGSATTAGPSSMPLVIQSAAKNLLFGGATTIYPFALASVPARALSSRSCTLFSSFFPPCVR